MRLIRFVQEHIRGFAEAGGEKPVPADAAVDQERMDSDLRQVRATNEYYFKFYWFTVVAALALTVTLAVLYREEMGGLATVLGAGGVLQGGLILRLAKEWKEKAHVDMVSVLCRNLPPEQLHGILMELLSVLRK